MTKIRIGLPNLAAIGIIAMASLSCAAVSQEKKIPSAYDQLPTDRLIKQLSLLGMTDLLQAVEDEIPVLVFDEVDANVGGETAHAVGGKMRQIADRHQVLCITHLAPVAAQATAHFVVSKELKAGRTISDFALLDRPSRVTELARMLGGQSDAARRHAESLLE